MQTLNLKASHKAVKEFYDQLQKLSSLGAFHEGAVSPAFASLLHHCAIQFKHSLVEKYGFKSGEHHLIADGAIVNDYNLVQGYWEAKDTADDMVKEIKKKFEAGYPKSNIIFQSPDRLVIWQNNQPVFDQKISDPETLIAGLKLFFEYEQPAIAQWEKAVGEFKLKVREIGSVMLVLIEQERKTNKQFIQAFNDFSQLCIETINPDISIAAVEEMLIQHLLTERIFRKVFNNPDFVERNVIAHEIEKVIQALTSHSFSRADFLKTLDPFYIAIEKTAGTISNFSEKQSFLNTVYENFFQGFSVKLADTHGIVYTPQPIVKFMVKSVAQILHKEFGRSISDEGVHIIDPFVGTGNFILSVMREMPKSKLPYKFANELHCNEVMLLPYYIASMNIEHEYYETVGEYKPFEGICLVDTFDMVKEKQFSFFVKGNTQRVKKQLTSPIFVVIGNPPYNAGQVNENDNNKNRKYVQMDKRVSQTYIKDSKASNKNDLIDPYVKAFRWASDRIKEEGIVTFVSNNSFIDNISFDGMRKHLEKDFESIYILDLGGNVRDNPKLSGTTHNVFGIQVGVSINFLVKKKKQIEESARIYYSRLDEFWKKEQKYDFLFQKIQIDNIEWQELQPDEKHTWLTEGLKSEFESLLALGTKDAKASKSLDTNTVFKTYSLGVSTNRDAWVYNFNSNELTRNINKIIEFYNEHVYKYSKLKEKPKIDDFVSNDSTQISWSEGLKNYLKRGISLDQGDFQSRIARYRPYTTMCLYFDKYLNERRYQLPYVFPKPDVENENRILCVSGIGSSKPFQVLTTNIIPSLDLLEKTQCFPFFTYSEEGINRQENITDWALDQFGSHYQDNIITKWDIFYYTYGLLHHPQYIQEYSANLRRDLPHIPFTPDFWGFSKAGKLLADLHVNYEKQSEYKLTWIEDPHAKLNYHVDKMVLSKDKTQIIYNDFLTLGGIPPEVFEYRLGNRSALEWIIDQYQVNTDKRSGITNDPNRADDPQYILRLIGQIITVSLETVKIVKSLPCIE
jgi:predicted helicase